MAVSSENIYDASRYTRHVSNGRPGLKAGDRADALEKPWERRSEGIIYSTGVLELIEFLGSRFEAEVSESETVPENLGSISRLTEFVMSKRPIRDPAC